jgi:hypothetical protein
MILAGALSLVLAATFGTGGCAFVPKTYPRLDEAEHCAARCMNRVRERGRGWVMAGFEVTASRRAA